MHSKNPFLQTPVTSIANLSGRARELGEITYFLESASAGNSSTAALVGKNGTGKTSLLNCAKEIAEKQNLVCVDLRLDHSKTRDLQSFWKNIYVAICYTAERKGCWSDKPSISKSLTDYLIQDGFQQPRFWNVDPSTCLDTLIRDDLAQFRAEVMRKSFSGAVIMIDNADLLDLHQYFLESLAGAFQGEAGVSLLLAGSPMLFSSIKTQGSLIRQFQKIDVDCFNHWSETQALIQQALGDQFERIGPTTRTIRQLHNLCVGNPAELQLYCFHMFKQQELSKNERMELTSAVYREVALSYRSSSLSNSLSSFDVFEKISNTLIPSCPWLQNCSLNAQENTILQIAKIELECARALSESEEEQISAKVSASYDKLFQLGISIESDCLKLSDEACFKGYWKSTAKLENGTQWKWNDSNFAVTLIDDVHEILLEKTGGAHASLLFSADQDIFSDVCSTLEGGETTIPVDWKKSTELLERVTSLSNETDATTVGEVFSAIKVMYDIMDSLLTLTWAFNNEKKNVCRIPVTIQLGESKSTIAISYFSSADPTEERFELTQFIKLREKILEKYGLRISVGKPKLFKIVEYDQFLDGMKKIGLVFPLFSTVLYEEAIEHFNNGEIEKACKCFQQIRGRSPHILNNIGFCKILLNEHSQARSFVEEALEQEQHPVFYNNRALIDFCEGNIDACNENLSLAWKAVSADWSEKAISMVVINSDISGISRLDNISIAVGLGLSMCRTMPNRYAEVNSILETHLSVKAFEEWTQLINSSSVNSLP